MAITIGGKSYNSYEEQILENRRNIKKLSGGDIIAVQYYESKHLFRMNEVYDIILPKNEYQRYEVDPSYSIYDFVQRIWRVKVEGIPQEITIPFSMTDRTFGLHLDNTGTLRVFTNNQSKEIVSISGNSIRIAFLSEIDTDVYKIGFTKF